MSQFPNEPPYRPGQPQPPQNPAGQPYYPPQSPSQPAAYRQPNLGQAGPTNAPYPPVYSQPSAPTPSPTYAQPTGTTNNSQIASFQKSLAIFLAYSFLIVGQVSGDFSGFNRLSVLGVLAALASLCGAVAVYRLEKNNSFVRFQALQAITLGICWTILTLIIDIINGALPIFFYQYVQAVLFIIYIYIIAGTIYRVACHDENYQIPLVGRITQFIHDPEA